MSLRCQSNLFGSVLGVGRQVVEGVVGLCDAAEEHRDHTCNTKTTELDKPLDYTISLKNNALVDTCRELLLFVCTREVGQCVQACKCACVLPVKPQASASRNVLQDMRKKSAVSSSWKSLSLVNFVTYSQSRS